MRFRFRPLSNRWDGDIGTRNNPFRAEILGLDPDHRWEIKATWDDFYEMSHVPSGELISYESVVTKGCLSPKREWTLHVSQCDGLQFPWLKSKASGNLLWREERLALFLKGKIRIFECSEFTVIHRDYEIELEIVIPRGSLFPNLALAAWFSMWVGGRHQPVD